MRGLTYLQRCSPSRLDHRDSNVGSFFIIVDHNALDKRGKILDMTGEGKWSTGNCAREEKTKSFKTLQAKFCRKFNVNNHPQEKPNLWLGTRISRHRKIPDLVGSWLQDVPTIWMRWEILSEGVWKRPPPPKTFPRSWSFTRTIAKNLKEGSSAVSIQNPNQA